MLENWTDDGSKVSWVQGGWATEKQNFNKLLSVDKYMLLVSKRLIYHHFLPDNQISLTNIVNNADVPSSEGFLDLQQLPQTVGKYLSARVRRELFAQPEAPAFEIGNSAIH